MTALQHPLEAAGDALAHAQARLASARRAIAPDQTDESVNISRTERIGSAAVGAALVAIGLSRQSKAGWLAALVGTGLFYRGLSGHCGGYQLLGINHAHAPAPADFYQRGIHVEHSLTINAPADQLYAFWRDFKNLPHIMTHLRSVEVTGAQTSRWTVAAPLGRSVSWDARLINDEPNRLLAWQSLAHADVHNAGSVRFLETADRGTEVHVVLDYLPPGGRFAKWFARVFGQEPHQQISQDLRRLKQTFETGERATIEGQPRGACQSCS